MSKVFLIPIVFIFLIDQLTKFFFYGSRNGTLNQGISFSFLSSASQLGQILLIFVMVVFVLFVWRQFGQKYPFLTGLLLGGAVSNIIDRLFFGGVRDFLPVPFVNIQNNLADWAIFVGLVGIVGREWWGSRNLENRK
jgi:signal peptidase II